MLEIREHAYKGRCFMTTGPVKAGSLLLTAPAYAAIPDSESKRRVCASCLQWCEPLPAPKADDGSTENGNEQPLKPTDSRLSPPMFLHHTCFSTYSNVEAIPGSRSVSLNELFFQGIPAKSSSKAHDNVKTCRVGPPCHQAFYCSMECSERDWVEYHVFECSFFREFFQGIPAPLLPSSSAGDSGAAPVRNQENFDNYTLDFMWLLMRILIRRAKSLSSMQSPLQPQPRPLDPIPFEKVWALCDNISAFPQESIDLYKKIAKQLLTFVKEHLLVGFSDVDVKDLLPSVQYKAEHFKNHPDQNLLTSLLYLICKEECNSFGLYTFRYKGPSLPRQGYGLAVFPDAVYFNHACAPNVGHVVRRSSQGTDLLFYSLRDLKEGEEALISYLDLESTPSPLPKESAVSKIATLERRSTLKGYFFFDCDCQRCAEELAGEKDTELGRHLKNQLCSVSGCRGRILPWLLPSNSSSSKTAGSVNRKDSGTVIHEDMRLWRCEACGTDRHNIACSTQST